MRPQLQPDPGWGRLCLCGCFLSERWCLDACVRTGGLKNVATPTEKELAMKSLFRLCANEAHRAASRIQVSLFLNFIRAGLTVSDIFMYVIYVLGYKM